MWTIIVFSWTHGVIVGIEVYHLCRTHPFLVTLIVSFLIRI